MGLFLRVRKRRKEEIRKLRFEEAMTALRTSAQTRLKNLHWDVLATVDGEESQCASGAEPPALFFVFMARCTCVPCSLQAPFSTMTWTAALWALQVQPIYFPTWRSSLDKRLEQHLLQGLGARRHLQSL